MLLQELRVSTRTPTATINATQHKQYNYVRVCCTVDLTPVPWLLCSALLSSSTAVVIYDLSQGKAIRSRFPREHRSMISIQSKAFIFYTFGAKRNTRVNCLYPVVCLTCAKEENPYRIWSCGALAIGIAFPIIPAISYSGPACSRDSSL